MIKKICLIAITSILLSSCVVVKGYQKVNLNDRDMNLSSKKADRFQITFQVYREGASGANGGKAGGGCGCN